MGTTFLDLDAKGITETVETWTPANATRDVFKAFAKAVTSKKKYAKDLDAKDMDDFLGASVKPELAEAFKNVRSAPTSLKLFTDGAFFSSDHKLYLSYEIADPKGKTTKKKVEIKCDWSAIKGKLKVEGARVTDQIAQTTGESEKSGKAEKKLRKNKAPTSWVLLEHPDISPLINQRIGRVDAETLGLVRLPVSVVISDKVVLAHLAEAANMPNVQEKVTLAAGWDKILDEVTDVAKQAAEMVRDDPANGRVVERLIQDTLDDAIRAALDRAFKQVDHFKEIRVDRRKYKIMATVKVVSGVAGLVAGVVGIALAPFTFGASLVLACAGLWRGAIQLGDQLGKLSLEAEDTAGLIATQVVTMLNGYKKWSKNAVGAGEVGKELLKVALPTDLIPTIKGVRGLLGTLNSKTNGIEISADELSKSLSELTDKELQATRAFEQFLRENKDVLTKKEKALVEKLLKKIPELRKAVGKALEDVIAMNGRVVKCRNYHDVLTAGYTNLSSKNPTWAVVVNELIPLAADVGIAAGGGIGGAMESLGSVAEAGKKAVDSIGLILSVGNDLSDIIDNTATEISNRKGK